MCDQHQFPANIQPIIMGRRKGATTRGKLFFTFIFLKMVLNFLLQRSVRKRYTSTFVQGQFFLSFQAMPRRRRRVGRSKKTTSLKRLLRNLATRTIPTGSSRSTKNLRRPRRRRSRATASLNRKRLYAKRLLNLKKNL